MRGFIQRSRSVAWASLLALVVLLAFAGTAAGAEEPPAITSPGEQAGVIGKAATVIVTGTNLASLTATGLPAGISQPVKVTASEWKIEGTPTTAETATVTLEAKNGEGTAGPTIEFKWTVKAPEAAPTITKPADQTSTAGVAITPLVIKGTNLAVLTPTQLPAGLVLTKLSATEWQITGTPTTVKATTVTLEARNAEGAAGTAVEFKWTVNAPVETPAKPVETPTPTPTPIPSAGRLGTVPAQKQGRELFATFLCEVATCKVSVKATIAVGKTKLKIHSSRVTILQGKKARIPLRLNKGQRELISAALKKRKKVTAALSATIDSSVGLQVTKALTVTVKR